MSRSVAAVCVLLCVLTAAGASQSRRSHHFGPVLDAVTPTATIVESIPEQIDLETKWTTYEGFRTLLINAKQSINLAAFYVDLSVGSVWPTVDGGWMGQAVYDMMVEAAQRGVDVRIVLNQPGGDFNDTDAFEMQRQGLAQVKSINWSPLFDGGILHTKLMVVDGKHAYIGSCNMGWTSFSQVKELGIVFQNASDVGADLNKVFEQYWYLADAKGVPQPWPSQYDTMYNLASPAVTNLNGRPTRWSVSVTPKLMAPAHRDFNLDVITSLMGSARQSICVSVMDYLPATLYQSPNIFFPAIDTAIRAAAFANVSVRLLISKWNHSYAEAYQYLYSLNDLRNVEVKLLELPDMAGTLQVPFTRVSHSKYMVTEDAAYVSTQNWTGDYFTNTGGMAVCLREQGIVSSLQAIFDRDWNSQYAHKLIYNNRGS